MQPILSKKNRMIAALCALLLVVYCSVGVCTNLLGSMQVVTDMAAMDHSHHNMSEEPQAEHCADMSGCDWSLNPVNDSLSSTDLAADFFFAYVIAASVFIMFGWLSTVRDRWHFAFARAQFYLLTYPRLHLQNAVFLN